MSWHIGPESLERYLTGGVIHSEAASLEAHLLACAGCRDSLARRADAGPGLRFRHQATWSRVAAAVDRPTLSLLERLLCRTGLPYSGVRLVLGAPTLRRAWWAAGTAVLTVAVLLAHLGSGTVGTVTFVVTAPVVPLAGVALSYGPWSEPAGEISSAAPYRPFLLVVLRTLLVLLSWFPVAGLLALALPTHPSAALLWFVPAVALCSLTLAASTVADPVLVAPLLSAAWLTTAGVAVRGPRWRPAGELLEQFVAFRPAGQVALVGVALAALTVAVVRRAAFDTWRTS